MNSRRNDENGWSGRSRAVAGATALAVVAVGCVGFALGLRLDLGAVSLVGNALFVAGGLALAYAAATELPLSVPELELGLLGPNRVGEVGFAVDFEDETV